MPDASVISAVASPLISGGFGILGNSIQYMFNRRLAEQQNTYNIDMWKMQNEYNSPSAQMARFSAAGLNPNLIYGQGSAGNATSAPQMVVPEAPDVDKTAQELAKAFNIQNLMLGYETIRKAKADADIARTNAENAKDDRAAMEDMGNLFSFDPVTGKYVFVPSDVTVIRPMSRHQRYVKDITGAMSTREYRFERLKENQYRNLELIPFRRALLEHQRDYLSPQIEMAEYDARMYPYSFWIGQGAKALQGIGSIIPKLKISSGRGYQAPNGRYYNY